MRPKKRVLVYCSDEQRLSVTAFVLEQRGFATVKCDSLASLVPEGFLDAACLLQPRGPEAVLLLNWLRSLQRELPVLLVARYGESAGHPLANVSLPSDASMAEICERLRCLAAGKRGPKTQAALPAALERENERVLA